MYTIKRSKNAFVDEKEKFLDIFERMNNFNKLNVARCMNSIPDAFYKLMA